MTRFSITHTHPVPVPVAVTTDTKFVEPRGANWNLESTRVKPPTKSGVLRFAGGVSCGPRHDRRRAFAKAARLRRATTLGASSTSASLRRIVTFRRCGAIATCNSSSHRHHSTPP